MSDTFTLSVLSTADQVRDRVRELAAAIRLTKDLEIDIGARDVLNVEVGIEHVGFTVEDLFVVGYGLDYAEQYRHLPYVAILDQHHPPPVERGRVGLRQ